MPFYNDHLFYVFLSVYFSSVSIELSLRLKTWSTTQFRVHALSILPTCAPQGLRCCVFSLLVELAWACGTQLRRSGTSLWGPRSLLSVLQFIMSSLLFGPLGLPQAWTECRVLLKFAWSEFLHMYRVYLLQIIVIFVGDSSSTEIRTWKKKKTKHPRMLLRHLTSVWLWL